MNEETKIGDTDNIITQAPEEDYEYASEDEGSGSGEAPLLQQEGNTTEEEEEKEGSEEDPLAGM